MLLDDLLNGTTYTAAAILLKKRNKAISLIPYVISTILKVGKTSKTVRSKTKPIIIQFWPILYFVNMILGTTRATTFQEVDQQLKTLNGPALLQNPEKEAKVQRFKMINKLSIYITCEAWKQKINEMSQHKSLKCKNCGV